MTQASAQWKATQCVQRLTAGDRRAADELLPLVYAELHAIATARLRRERPDHTLQPTALVNEVYLKLVSQDAAELSGRAHFLAVATDAIRRILIDHARIRSADKRRAPGARISLSEDLDAAQTRELDLLCLDEALGRLAALNPRQARVVELRFFGGLSAEETARVLNISENTVKGDWRVARAWLATQLTPERST